MIKLAFLHLQSIRASQGVVEEELTGSLVAGLVILAMVVNEYHYGVGIMIFIDHY
jgi:hypothetical protein